MLLQDRVTYVRLELHPFYFQVFDTYRLEEGKRLTRPEGIIQFVKGDNRPFRHSGQEMLYGHPGRLVQIEIEKQQAHYQVLVAGDKLRDCLDGISFNQFHLGNMSQEAGAVVDSGEFAQLVVGAGEQTACSDLAQVGAILFVWRREALEGIETVYSPGKVDRLQLKQREPS